MFIRAKDEDRQSGRATCQRIFSRGWSWVGMSATRHNNFLLACKLGHAHAVSAERCDTGGGWIGRHFFFSVKTKLTTTSMTCKVIEGPRKKKVAVARVCLCDVDVITFIDIVSKHSTKSPTPPKKDKKKRLSTNVQFS